MLSTASLDAHRAFVYTFIMPCMSFICDYIICCFTHPYMPILPQDHFFGNLIDLTDRIHMHSLCSQSLTPSSIERSMRTKLSHDTQGWRWSLIQRLNLSCKFPRLVDTTNTSTPSSMVVELCSSMYQPTAILRCFPLLCSVNSTYFHEIRSSAQSHDWLSVVVRARIILCRAYTTFLSSFTTYLSLRQQSFDRHIFLLHLMDDAIDSIIDTIGISMA